MLTPRVHDAVSLTEGLLPCDPTCKASLQPGTYPVLTPRTFSLSTNKDFPSRHIYRINTGSPLPRGTDAVVMVEDTELVRTAPSVSERSAKEDTVEDEVEVKLLVGAKSGENVRAPGSDIRKGEPVLEKGTLVSSLGGEIGTLAFVGQTKVSIHLFHSVQSLLSSDNAAITARTQKVNVIRKPVVALLSTGNEVIDLQGVQDQQLGERGRDGWTGTFDTNRPSLAAVLRGMGYEVLDFGIVSDEWGPLSTTSCHVIQSYSDSIVGKDWKRTPRQCVRLFHALTSL